ncbi:ATP-binding protein [Modestobacter versicolor]|uniref:histidine kinase n=1 Tax=Modestobacter versicolor TaxID=429133 RepID=A0A323VDX1_9ACTN|nr:ATP-binding protein [Modestobacter versicolor]MBB3674421.1 signal transduction histidine kinase [Modestobacter versicolor]PZA22243.1 histidine kinase [Modestobacter versicolor]
MTATTPQVDIAELRTLFLFESLGDPELQWVAERAEVRVFDGDVVVFAEGEPADALYMLLDGGLLLTKHADGEDVVINDTTFRGAYSGAVRAYATGHPEEYQTTLRTTRPSRFLWLSAADFATLVTQQCPMAVHLLDGLYEGVRATESAMRQREHLVQLGHLSANLAHELNNPAAAAVRATEQLRGRLSGIRHKLGLLAGSGLSPELVGRLVKAQEIAVERASKPRPDLTALEESDLEESIAERLDEVGVDNAYDLAPVFATAGMDAQWVDDVVEQVDSGLEWSAAFGWLRYTLETETLMDEIEEAATRISSLVGAVKQYSHMDQAQHQDLDVKPGIESTLVMLARKLNGIQVHREYAADLPTVPGYPAELNQVWTNLIDNAADAMAGGGLLTLRTRADADAVFVEVGDDGPGVPESVRTSLFDAFVTTKPAGEGSGLGLETARRIVERRHGGSLSYTTGPEGTTFCVRLPRSRTRG